MMRNPFQIHAQLPSPPNERAECGNASCYEATKRRPWARAGRARGREDSERGVIITVVPWGRTYGSLFPIVCADRVLKSSALCHHLARFFLPPNPFV